MCVDILIWLAASLNFCLLLNQRKNTPAMMSAPPIPPTDAAMVVEDDMEEGDVAAHSLLRLHPCVRAH